MKIKILSALLMVSFSLASFNVHAFVDIPASDMIDYIYEFDVGEFVKDDAVIEGKSDSDSERIELLNSLGLWDDVEKSKSAILTSAEFSAIISKIKAGSYSVSANENVTYGETVETLLKILGYDNRVALYSNKDEAIISIATDIGLIKGEIKNNSSYITRAELAKLLERAITIDICVMKYENETYTWIIKEGETILNSFHDIHNVSGFVNAITGLSVYGNAYLRDGYMEIDRVAVNASGIDVTKYLGRMVKAYAKYDEAKEEYKLCYIGIDDKYGKSVEIDFQDIEQIKDDYISYTDSDGILRKEKVQNYKAVVENGKNIGSISKMSNFEKNEGKIILSSSEKNGDFDVAMIYIYNYYAVKYVDTFQERIGLEFGQKFNGSEYIQIDEEAVNHIIVDGAISDYTKIPPKSTIRVFKNDATGYTNISAVTNKQSGVISKLDDNYIVIADKRYRMSENLLELIKECEKNPDLPSEKRVKKPEVGDNVILYLFGDVLAGYTSGDEYIYAYLKSAKFIETDADEVMQLRVFTQNISWLDLTFAKKITLDGVKGVLAEDAAEIIRKNKDVVTSNLVRIKVNGKGEITALDTMIETDAEKETIDDLAYVPEYTDGTTVFKHSWDNWSLKNTRYMFSDKVSVFVIPDNEEREEKYKVVGATAFTRDQQYKITLYSPDELLQVPAMVYRGDMSSGANEKERWLYVTKINQTLNEETDELEYEVVGMNCGSYGLVGIGYCQEEKFVVSADDYDAAVQVGNGFSVGDFMYIEYTGKKLQKWVMETEIEKGKIVAEPGIYDNGWIMGNNCQVAVGTVEKVKLDGTHPLIRINCGSTVRVYVTHCEAIIDPKSKKFTTVELSDIHEGDFVYAIVIGNYCSIVIKNI